MTKYLPQMESVPVEQAAQALLQQPQRLIAQEEERFQGELEQACSQILREQIHMVLLTGPSASGKTTTAKKLLAAFTFPLFLFTYFPISLSAFFSKVEWKPIEHRVSAASLHHRRREELLPF